MTTTLDFKESRHLASEQPRSSTIAQRNRTLVLLNVPSSDLLDDGGFLKVLGVAPLTERHFEGIESIRACLFTVASPGKGLAAEANGWVSHGEHAAEASADPGSRSKVDGRGWRRGGPVFTPQGTRWPCGH